MSRTWWVRRLFARRPQSFARLAVSRLEDRTTPALLLGYDSATAALSLSETAADDDAVQFSEVGSKLRIFLFGAGAAFDPASTTDPLFTYQSPGNPGASKFVDLNLADPAVLAATDVNTGSGSDTVFLNVPTFSLGETTVTASTADESVVVVQAANTTGLTATAKSVQVNGSLANTGPNAVVLTTTASANTGGLLVFGSITSDDGDILLTGDATGVPFNQGVLIASGSTITTTGTGNVSITGTGGPGSFGVGVAVDGGSVVEAAGSGSIFISGTGGGSADGEVSPGVFVGDGGSVVRTAGGSITLFGTPGQGTDSAGISIQDDGSVVSNGGPVTFVADSVNIDTDPGSNPPNSGFTPGIGTVDAGTGTFTVRPRTAGLAIDLGTDDSPGTLGLTAAELAQVTAGGLVIGSPAAGNLTLSADITLATLSHVILFAGGLISSTPTAGSFDTAGGSLLLRPSGVFVPARAGTDVTALSLDFAPNTAITLAVNGPTPDAEYDRLVVAGTANLFQTRLAFTGTYTPGPTETLTVVSATSVTNTFLDAPDGAVVVVNGRPMRIRYTATAVTLTAIPTLAATIDGSGNLVIADTAGLPDRLTVRLSGTNLVITDAAEQFAAAPPGGTLSNGGRTLTLPLSKVSGQLLFNTGGGNDVLTVDQGGGAVPRPIVFDGGDPTTAPGDKLVVTGGSFGTVVGTFLDAHSGLITFDSSPNTIRYTGLEPVDMTGTTAAALVFNLPAAASTAVLEDDGTSGNGVSRLRSGNGTFETTTFSNPAGSLTINRGTFTDTLSVTDLPDFTAGLTVGGQATPFASVNLGGTVTLAGQPLAVTAGLIGLSTGKPFATGGADATLVADAMILAGGQLSAGGGRVTLRPLSAGNSIDLGGADGPGVLGLTAAELNAVTAGVLRVGSNATAGLTVSAPVAPAGTAQLELVAGGAITATAAAPTVTVARLSLSGFAGVHGPTPGTPFTTAVTNLAGVSATGDFVVLNAGDLTIGGAGGVITGVSAAGDLLLSVTPGGTLAVPEPVAGSGANVELTADRMLLTAPVSAPTAGVGNVRLLTASAGLPINLGPTTDLPGSLSISDAEFQLLTAGRLVQIGLGDDPLAGPIGVFAPITAPAGVSALVLASGSNITQSLTGALTVARLGVALLNPITTVILTAANAVSVFACLAVNDPAHVLPTGTVSFASSLPLTIGRVGSIVGLTAGTAAVSTTGNALTLVDPVVTDGTLTLGVATAGGGGTATVPGNLLDVPGGVTVIGGAGDDTFNVSGSAKSTIRVIGLNPVRPASPGDTLNYTQAAAGLTVSYLTPSDGTLTEAGLQPVQFVSIETLRPSGAITEVDGRAGPDYVWLYNDGVATQYKYSSDGGATFGNPVALTGPGFKFVGNGGRDVLKVDYTVAGDPLAGFTSDVQFDGSDRAGDTLAVFGSGQIAYYRPTGVGAGTVSVTEGAGPAVHVIQFANLSPVDITGMNRVVVAPSGAVNNLSVAEGFDNLTGTVPALRVTGTSDGAAVEQLAAWNNLELWLDTRFTAAADTVTITGAANAHGNTNLRVFTGPGPDIVRVLGPVAVAGDFEVRSADVGVAAGVTAGAGLTLANTGTLTLGTATLQANNFLQAGPGPVVLTGGTATVRAIGLDVSFGSPIDGAANGVGTLDIQAVTVSLSGSVGATVRPASLRVTGGFIQASGAVYQTTGDLVFTGLVSVAGPTVRFDSASGDVRFPTPPGGFDVLTSPVVGSAAVTVAAGKAAVFGGGVGRLVALGSLTVSASTTQLVGDVTTTGKQAYLGPVVLTADVALTGGELLFASTVDGDGTPSPNRGLTVTVTDSTKAATFNGYVGIGSPGNLPPFTTQALRSVTVNGASVFNSSGVQTVGDQVYNGAVRVAGGSFFVSVPATDYSVNVGTGGVRFAGPLDAVTAGGGAAFVETSGPIRFERAVGGVAALSALSAGNGPISFAGPSVTTTGGQFYNGFAFLETDVVFTATNPPPAGPGDPPAGDVRFDSLLNSKAAVGTFGATVNTPGGGATTFNAKVGFAYDPTFGLLAFLKTDAAGTTRFGTATSFDAELAVVTTGAQTYGDPVVFGKSLTLTAGGAVRFGGTLDADPGPTPGTFLDLSVTSPTGTTFDGAVGGAGTIGRLTVSGPARVNGGLVRTVITQSYTGAVVVGADTTFDAPVFYADNVSFGGPLDSDPGQARAVTVAGNAVFSGAVGGTDPLARLAVAGTARVNGGLVRTRQEQSFAGSVTVATKDALFRSLDDKAVTFGGGLGGPAGVRVTTAGDTTISGGVGGGDPLAFLITDGGGLTKLFASIVYTVGDQLYFDRVQGAGFVQEFKSVDPVAYAAGRDVPGTGTISFLDPSAASVVTPSALTIRTSGRTTFAGGVTAGAVLVGTTIPANTGPTDLNGGFVTTVGGTQFFYGPVVLTKDAVLTGLSVRFFDRLDSDGTPRALTVAGVAEFARPVGSVSPLASLVAGGGASVLISGGLIRTVGAQTYTAPVAVTGPVNFRTVDPAGVQPCGTGDITFAAALTSDAVVTVSTMGKTEFLGAVTTKGLVFDCPGLIDLNGGTVDTGTGPQSYAGDVVLTADTTLIAGSVTFGGRLDAEAKTAWRLNVLAPATFMGQVGGLAPLGRLDMTGAATVGGGLVRTTDTRTLNPGEGSQNFAGPVTVTADTAFVAGGKATGAITFFSTLDSVPAGFAVRVTTAGDTVFGGAVGKSGPLGELATDGGGTTFVRGGLVRTSAVAGRSGSQFYQDDVRVAGSAATFTVDVTNPGLAPLPPDVQAVRFAGRLDAAPGSSPDVTVTAPGDVTFAGPVGGLALLGSLDVTGVGDLAFNGGGTTTVGGGSVTTAGRQRYAQQTVLAGDTTFTAGGDVLFDNRLDAAAAGKAAADVRTPGLTRFRGEVGLTNALSSVTTDKFGGVEFAGALVRTTGAQTYLDPARVTVGTEFRSEGGQAVRFDQTLDGPAAALVTTTGLITFQGSVGATTPLESVLAGGGPIAVNGGLVRANPSFGRVRFTGPVTVGADTTFAATSDIGGGFQGVFFDRTLTGPGKAVVVNTGATTFFGGDVTVGSLTTDGQGSSRIATVNVTATGAIDFGDEVSGDTPTLTVTGGSVLFRRLLNGPNTDVTIKSAGSTKFGSTVLVKSLTTDAPGTTTVSGRSEVFTSGSQVFGDPVAVEGDNTNTTVFRSTGAGRIEFGNTLTGPFEVNVDTAGDTVFNGGVDVGSLVANGGGRTLVNGGIVRTARLQRYDDPVTVGKQAVVFQDGGTGVAFISTLDGGQPVRITTAGNTVFGANVGTTTRLTSLTLDGGGRAILPAIVFVAGEQDYADELLLAAADTTLGDGATNGAGHITLRNRVAGADPTRPAASLSLAAGRGVDQPSGQLANIDTLRLTGGGKQFVDQPANDVRALAVAASDSTRYSDATDLTLDSLFTNGAPVDVRLRTGQNFTATGFVQTGGRLAVYLGLLKPAAVTFTAADPVAAAIILGLPGTKANGQPDTPPPGGLPDETGAPAFGTANIGADRFTVRPSSGAPFFVYGNNPRPPLSGTVGDSLQPDFAGAAVTQFQYDGQDGFYDVAGRQRLTFSSIEALTGLSQAAFVAQTGEPNDGTGATSQQYNVRVVRTQNGTPLPGGLDGARLPENPFVVSPALVNPAASTQPPRVAFGDFNGDNVTDLVLANGPGTPPLVTVIDGRALDPALNPDGSLQLVNGRPVLTRIDQLQQRGFLLAQFYAYDPGFQGGVNVAVGKLGPGGRTTITTGADTGGGPHVRTFELVAVAGQPAPFAPRQLTTSFGNFYAYESSFTGGVRVAVADVTGDGVDDLVLAAGPGGGPRVRVFDGKTTGAGTAELTGFTPAYADFFTVEPTFRGGLYVAAGFHRSPQQAGTKADIVVGAAGGGGPRVMIFDGSTLNPGTTAPAQLANFFAFTPQEQNDLLFGGTNYYTGVGGVAFGGRGGNGYLDVLVSTGRGPQLQVRRFRGGPPSADGTLVQADADLTQLTTPTSKLDDQLFSFPPLVDGTGSKQLDPRQLTYGATVGGVIV